MNEYALRLERDLRTIRDRLDHELGSERRDGCLAIYLVDIALDAVESANSAESAHDLALPPALPKKEWCRDCGGCRR